MSTQFTDRDNRFLRLLSCHVRTLTLDQVAREFWPNRPNARHEAVRRLRRLPVELSHVVDQPVLPMEAPVVCWSPGGFAPDADQIAYQLQQRWSARLVRHTMVTLHDSRPVRATERLHDACLSEIYLRHYRDRSDKKWVVEDNLFDWTLGKRPDAVVYPVGKPPIAIECGGKYPAEKIRALHAEYSARNVPYQIW